MNWRETLGGTPVTESPSTHNSHNSQKPHDLLNCADIADTAYRDSEEETSRMLEELADACRGLDISPAEVKATLSPEDVQDWREGAISGDTLAAFAQSLVQRREMDQGKRPADYTSHASCRHCGPVWLWFSGEVLGCPWCWNRSADKPIPRPCSVRCGDCLHFERIDHPHVGHCAKGEPEAIAGLWDTDRRYCERFLPKPVQTNHIQQKLNSAEAKK